MSPALIDVTKFARPRRRAAGAPPDAVYDPLTLATFAAGEERWALDLLRAASKPHHWASLRLRALSSVETPSTYWLSWHVRDQRFSRSHDAGQLEGGRPALYRAVRATLRELPIQNGLPAPLRPEDLV